MTSVNISDLSAWCRIDFDGEKSNPLNNGAKLYLNGNLLTDLIIPEDIVEIKYFTFCNYESLTSVIILDNVISIDGGAFYDCDALTSVTIGNSVASIGSNAFSSCSALTKFYCYATTPPDCQTIALSGIQNNNATLYVPKGCKSVYESSNWASYFSEIKEMEE